MKEFRSGFGRVDITPELGVHLAGYYQVRVSDKLLDRTEANAVAFAFDDQIQVFVCLDLCSVPGMLATTLRELVAESCGIPVTSVHISATHSHTTPIVGEKTDVPINVAYTERLKGLVVEAAKLAVEDLKPARMGWAVGQAPGIAFVRRFRMKDGSIQTNPGVRNPMILEPLGDVDERVAVLRIAREGAPEIVVVNFGNHPDTIGGCNISGDWPAATRRKVEEIFPNTHCIFFNGAEGDVNHVNVWPEPGDGNGLSSGFDDVSRGYAHTLHMGNVVAGAVLQVYEKVAWIPVEQMGFVSRMVRIPSSRPAPEDLPEAHRINDLYQAGREHELPYEGMMLTTVVAEAVRMVRLEHGPDYFEVPMTAVSLGNVALLTIPGEAFTDLGRAWKKAPGWDVVLPLGLTDDSVGYFPVTQAYVEGGYEARSSKFRQGVAELLIDSGLEMLQELRK